MGGIDPKIKTPLSHLHSGPIYMLMKINMMDEIYNHERV